MDILQSMILIPMNFLFFGFYFCSGADTYDDRMQLIERLLTNYSRHIRPRFDQREIVDVRMEPLIDLIVKFDEAIGVFSWYGTFEIDWIDERITWNVTENGGIEYIDIPLKDVWIPKLIVANSANKRTIFAFDHEFDYETATVLYRYDGFAFAQQGGMMDTSCHANILFYPGDMQICDLILHGERYDMALSAHKEYNLLEHVLKYYQLDAEWEITNVTYSTPVGYSKFPTIKFGIHIKRKPMFIVINLILPIILVGILNVFTFVLPIESQERISFAVILFLTFVVAMTVVSEKLPATDTIGYFSIFLILRIVTSAFTTIASIYSTYFYYKNDLTGVSSGIVCCRRFCSHGKHRVEVDKHWKHASNLMDKICILVLVVELLIELICLVISLVH